MSKIKWRSMLALALIIASVIFDFNLGWALLFTLWLIPDLKSKVTYLMEPVGRKESPLLYWAIVSTWSVLIIYLVLFDLAPHTLPKGWAPNTYKYSAQLMGSYQPPAKNQGSASTLDYKEFKSDSFVVAGLSALSSYQTLDMDEPLERLWNDFAQKDLSELRKHSLDTRIYLVQSGFDEEKPGYYRATLGYQVPASALAGESRARIHVPPHRYAVVELKNNPMEKLKSAWGKILQSNLKLSHKHNVEVYSMSSSSGEIEQIDLWLSLD